MAVESQGNEKKTKTGKSIQKYIRGVLDQASKAGETAITAGYPGESPYTSTYYAGVPYLYEYGDAEQKQALGRMGDLYGAYGRAGGYNRTDFSDLEGRYGQAGQYGPMDYGDIESEYGGIAAYDPRSYSDVEADYRAAGQYGAMDYGDIESAYGGITDYAPTQYGDIEAGYRSTLGYDPREYDRSDYTTQNIQSRMNPYEELVSDRARARLKKAYDEAGAERQAQAQRAGAFGGSGAAIQEEVARRNYLEQMADINAQNLQQAYESGAGLYGREMAENLAAGQAEEASRQFGAESERAGLAGLMATRGAEQQGLEFLKKLQLDVESGRMTARQAQEASRQFGQEAKMSSLAGVMGARGAEDAATEFLKKLQLDVQSGKMTARQAEEASRQFGKQAEFSGLEGMMGAREQTAAQEAAAKEAEFEALRGQGTSAQQQAVLAEQRKNMQRTNLGAMQQAGQQQTAEQLARQEYPLDVSAQQANILAPMGGSAIQTKQKQPSLGQNILGGITAGIGIGSGIGLFREGGLVYANGGVAYLPKRVMQYSGGGLADLEPEYYSGYEY